VINLWQLGLQLVERYGEVGPPLGVVDVLGRGPGQALATQHGVGGVDELARPRDQAHALQAIFQSRCRAAGARPAEHLERQLRRAGAKRVESQILEHHIG
jgi:hypothetical protein